jgi:hypothetical protein
MDPAAGGLLELAGCELAQCLFPQHQLARTQLTTDVHRFLPPFEVIATD